MTSSDTFIKTPKPPTTSTHLLNLSILSPGIWANQISKGEWYAPPHLKLLDKALVDVAFGSCRRLIVTMPPRHGKSELISKYFPAWFLGMYRSKRVILASYGSNFAGQWGRKARNLLEEHGYMFNLEISRDSSSAEHWEIEKYGGGMQTAGIGGPITGKGADLLIIDDPVKDDEEARSQVMRDKTYEWYASTAYTRLEPGGAVILVMTRWHEDDLAGRLLKDMSQGGDRWKVLNLPAIAEDNDQLGRSVGEALWSDRYPLERLTEIKNTIGTYYWQSLYQQTPMSPGGNVFKTSVIPIVSSVPAILRTVRYWDKAATEDGGDYTVGARMGEQNGIYFILDIIRVRRSSADVENIIAQAAASDGRGTVVGMEEEGGSSGKDVSDHYRRKVLRGYMFQAFRPSGSKVVRAMPFAAAVEQGRVKLYNPGEASWIGPYISELSMFPNGEHDDQVDASSGAYNMLSKGEGSNLIKDVMVTQPTRIPGLSRSVSYESSSGGIPRL